MNLAVILVLAGAAYFFEMMGKPYMLGFLSGGAFVFVVLRFKYGRWL